MIKQQVMALNMLFCGGLMMFSCGVGSLTADQVIDKSIRYHDPSNQWHVLKKKFEFDEIRPSGEVRKSEIWIDQSQGFFKVNRNNEEIHGMKMDSCFIELGDVDCARAERLRNYYLYLWGLPMKIRDSGTSIKNDYTESELRGQAVYIVSVPYETDTWTFHIDQKTYRMLEYGFVKGDGSGENIKLSEEFKVDGIRIPAVREWYTLEGEYLGKDILTSTSDF